MEIQTLAWFCTLLATSTLFFFWGRTSRKLESTSGVEANAPCAPRSEKKAAAAAAHSLEDLETKPAAAAAAAGRERAGEGEDSPVSSHSFASSRLGAAAAAAAPSAVVALTVLPPPPAAAATATAELRLLRPATTLTASNEAVLLDFVSEAGSPAGRHAHRRRAAWRTALGTDLDDEAFDGTASEWWPSEGGGGTDGGDGTDGGLRSLSDSNAVLRASSTADDGMESTSSDGASSTASCSDASTSAATARQLQQEEEDSQEQLGTQRGGDKRLGQRPRPRRISPLHRNSSWSSGLSALSTSTSPDTTPQRPQRNYEGRVERRQRRAMGPFLDPRNAPRRRRTPPDGMVRVTFTVHCDLDMDGASKILFLHIYLFLVNNRVTLLYVMNE